MPLAHWLSLVPWQWTLSYHLPCWDSSLYPSSSASLLFLFHSFNPFPSKLYFLIISDSWIIWEFKKIFLNPKLTPLTTKKECFTSEWQWTLSFRTHPLIPIKQENCLCSFLESTIFPTLNRSNYQFKVKGSLHISKGLNVYTTLYTNERMWLNVT